MCVSAWWALDTRSPSLPFLSTPTEDAGQQEIIIAIPRVNMNYLVTAERISTARKRFSMLVSIHRARIGGNVSVLLGRMRMARGFRVIGGWGRETDGRLDRVCVCRLVNLIYVRHLLWRW